MRTPLLLVAALALAGCGPAEGEVYEHKLTQRRVEVQRVGRADDLAEYYDGLRAEVRALDEEVGITPLNMSEALFLADSTDRAVAYSRGGLGVWTIVPLADFEEEYSEVD